MDFWWWFLCRYILSSWVFSIRTCFFRSERRLVLVFICFNNKLYYHQILISTITIQCHKRFIFDIIYWNYSWEHNHLSLGIGLLILHKGDAAFHQIIILQILINLDRISILIICGIRYRNFSFFPLSFLKFLNFSNEIWDLLRKEFKEKKQKLVNNSTL